MPAEPQQISQSARLEQLELRDPAQQRARLGAHALRVGEVAGVVVGDAQRERMARRLRLVLGEQLGDVADPAENAAARSAHSGSSASRCA